MGELVQHKRAVIHWTEAAKKGGNPFVYKPTPLMLLKEGTLIMRKFQGAGRGAKELKQVEFVDVLYDRDYIAEYILNNVVSCFPGITHVQMRELFTEALKLRKQREEKRVSEQG